MSTPNSGNQQEDISNNQEEAEDGPESRSNSKSMY